MKFVKHTVFVALAALSTQAIAGSKFINPFNETTIQVRCNLGTDAYMASIYWKPAGINSAQGELADRLQPHSVVIEADWNTQELSIENLQTNQVQTIKLADMEQLFEISAGSDTYVCAVISEDPNP